MMFFFNDTATTEIYTLSLHDALPISWGGYRSRQFFPGRFCEVRVWSRALSATEIAAGLCAVDPKAEGLEAYWKFNENSGHVFHDATKKGFDMDWTNTWRDDRENG